MGFPFMAYMGKARALAALHREAEAKKVLDQALAQAKLANARAEEVQLLIVLGRGRYPRVFLHLLFRRADPAVEVER